MQRFRGIQDKKKSYHSFRVHQWRNLTDRYLVKNCLVREEIFVHTDTEKSPKSFPWIYQKGWLKHRFAFFYLLRRKERSNSSRDQVLSTECRCCPTLSGDGLKLLYSNLGPYWLTRWGVPSFDWPQGVFSGRVSFLKGKNEHHTTLETRDKATAAAARPTLSPSTCS